MPVRISCPNCNFAYNIDESLRGKTILCRKCEQRIAIPASQPPRNEPIVEVIAAKSPRPPSARASQPRELERPVKRNRVSEDEPPEKKAKGFGLLLFAGTAFGILGLLCAGGLGLGGYFYYRTQTAQVSVNQPAKMPNVPQPAPPPVELKLPLPAPDNPVKNAGASGSLNGATLAKVKAGTVYIRVTLPGNQGVGQGSGFFAFESGIVLTNAHVVHMLEDGSPPPQKVEVVYKSGEKDSRTFVAQILGVDRSSDLAVLKIQGPSLPEPLTVKQATTLTETERVYIFGFPLGNRLGESITVSESSVSSLRKSASGELDKIQVNGGMHPGNSGGPVVNSAGEVVGVAVSGISGTQINFAIPGEYVHTIFNGRVLGLRFGETRKAGSDLKAKVYVELLDPLNRVAKISLDSWIGPPNQPRPPGPVAAVVQPGDTPHQSFDMTYKRPIAEVEVTIPPDLKPSQMLYCQPMIVNGAGVTRWSASVAIHPAMPPEPIATSLALKHMWGARPLVLTSKNVIGIKLPGQAEERLTINMVANMTESMVDQQDNLANLRMRYLKYQLGLPTELMTPEMSAKLRFMMQMTKFIHADLQVDDANELKKNKVDVGNIPAANRSDLQDMHQQIQQSLEMLSVPLARGLIQPNQTWRGRKPLLIQAVKGEMPMMDVTYTYLGIRDQFGNKEAVIRISGKNSQTLKGAKLVGTVNGFAYFDLSTSQIASAAVNANVEIQLPTLGLKKTETLESRLQRTLGQELLKVKDVLTAESPKDAKGCASKSHQIDLQAGKKCVVSVESPKGPTNFDTYVRVIDPSGRVVIEDDDSGTDLNSMAVFTPAQTGSYRILVSAFEPNGVGDYLLVVRQANVQSE